MVQMGADWHDSHDRDWTLLLPDEVLEQVLVSVPALDLVVSGRLVCRRWRRVLAGRPLWRRVRVLVRVGREQDACRVLRAVPALAELALFAEDREATRRAHLVLQAVRDAAAAGLQLHALTLDWRHFAADAASRACFHGILVALRGVVRHLDVGLVGVQPVEDDASSLHPRPAPALAALAALTALHSLRVRALFDPCWYFGEMRDAVHSLRLLDAVGCESYLTRLLADLVDTHGHSLQGLRLTARGLDALKASSATRADGGLHLPVLQHLAVDLEHQDGVLFLDQARTTCERLGRLTLTRMNRRLPPPGEDKPSEAVRSVCSTVCGQRRWGALHTLVLEDCLVSPADLSALLDSLGHQGCGRGLQQLVFIGGCFLGSELSLTSLTAAGQAPRPGLLCRGLRLCPRDTTTGLYPLALEGSIA